MNGGACQTAPIQRHNADWAADAALCSGAGDRKLADGGGMGGAAAQRSWYFTTK